MTRNIKYNSERYEYDHNDFSFLKIMVIFETVVLIFALIALQTNHSRLEECLEANPDYNEDETNTELIFPIQDSIPYIIEELDLAFIDTSPNIINP